jgi:hypothetical protein
MSGLFSTNAPTPKPAAPMPDSSSASVLEARRRAQLDIMNRAGRSSTILTAPRDRGGDSYSSTTLGAST